MKKLYFENQLFLTWVALIGLSIVSFYYYQNDKIKNEEIIKIERELIKLKNQAFCDCYCEVTKNEPIKYKDGSTYVQIINLKDEYIFGNKHYKKIIDNWVKKEYKSYDPNNNLYLMKCLDFYNSKELEKFIDSIRQKEIR